ncbi:hypothetical protein J6590_049896 [Homalodisca vitripennis]|nr:hypothetical protein J6590_049896 [Homalodisca vitripennis]
MTWRTKQIKSVTDKFLSAFVSKSDSVAHEDIHTLAEAHTPAVSPQQALLKTQTALPGTSTQQDDENPIPTKLLTKYVTKYTRRSCSVQEEICTEH